MKRFAAVIIITSVLTQVVSAGTITGIVTDDSNGQPIQGLWVYALKYDTGEYCDGNSTNPDGVYSISDLATGTYKVVASGSGTQYAAEFYNNQISWDRATPVNVSEGQQITGIDFSLGPGASISGVVKNSSGVGQANIQVNCWANDGYGTGDWTEANGFYECGGLPVGYNYNVVAYPPPDSNYMITRITVDVYEAGEYTDQDIILGEGGFKISGKVTNKATGVPLEGIRVGCYLEDLGVWGGDDNTDVNGFYQLTNLPPGEVEIRAEPESYYAGIGTVFYLEQDVNDLDFALPAGATLSGKVLDTETAQPLAGIEVTYWSERYAVWQNDYTDAEGEFMFTKLPGGIGEIIARPTVESGYGWSLPWGANWFYLNEGQDHSNRLITVQKGALVSGYIKDSNNVPLSNIEYDWEGRMCEGWGDSDIDGYYEVRLPLGTYVIGVDMDEEDFRALHQEVTITDVNHSVDANITVYSEQTGGQISGDVCNPGGHPKTGVFIVVAFEAGTVVEPNNWYTISPVGEAELTDAGPFAVTALPPDVNYDLHLCVISESADGRESLAVRDSALDISIGTTDVNLYYNSEGNIVTGSVVNTDSRAVLGATVLLTSPATEDIIAGFGDTDCNGQYVIYNVPAGTYMVTAVHSKYLNASTAVEVDEGTTVDVNTIVMQFSGEKEAADLNGDGNVNTKDLAQFAQQWLDSGDADFNQDGTVSFNDFARFAQNWLWRAMWYHDNI